jgi:hypothetical protein
MSAGSYNLRHKRGNKMAAMKKVSPALKKKAYAMAEKAEPKKAKAKELKKGMAMLMKKKGK